MAIDDLLHSQVALYGEIDDRSSKPAGEPRRPTPRWFTAGLPPLPGSTGFGQGRHSSRI
jgi:hypothetical protein